MNKTELLGKLSADPEERLLLARALDKLELCRTRNIPAHTQFLSLAEQAAAEPGRAPAVPVMRGKCGFFGTAAAVFPSFVLSAGKA